MNRNPFDHTLYAILDPEVSLSGEIVADALAIAEGGATAFQLRCKTDDTRRFLQTARAVSAALTDYELPLLINDRVDIAQAADADGVHLGWQDMPVPDARRILGENAVIGLSIKTREQAEKAPVALLDYCCIGGFFPTSTKDGNGDALGPVRYRILRDILGSRAPDLPVGAIAGITAENAREPVLAGADGVAVISALSNSKKPGQAAANLRGAVEQARKLIRT